MILDKYHYIAIEGPIGAGKTSLARRIASLSESCRLEIEKPEKNPFLAKFYEDSQRYALQTQLFFLFQRVQELQEMAQPDLFRKYIVTDFLLEKDPLFAKLNLSDDEFHLYLQMYNHMKPQVPAPDLVIYLQASPERLVERVKKRGIGIERGISEEYLRKLADLYSRFFHNYDSAPVFMVNSDNLNFAEDEQDFHLLLDRIGQMRGSREFFNKGV